MSNQSMAAAGAGGWVLALAILVGAFALGTLFWQGFKLAGPELNLVGSY